MDEFSMVGSRADAPTDPLAEVPEQPEARKGEDRRLSTDRRRGNHRLLALHSRRDGDEPDRRRVGRRVGNASWLSFLWRWALWRWAKN